MKRAIQKPYKTNYTLYLGIIIVSLVLVVLMTSLTDVFGARVADVITNLVYGCIASTIVALLIEVENTKSKNEKAYELYDFVFGDLKFSIYYYIQFWSRACAVLDRKHDYSQETHRWMEWYNKVKDNISAQQEEKKNDQIAFVKSNIREGISLITSSVKLIESQRYVLKINDVYNSILSEFLRDLSIEFGEGMLFVNHDVDEEVFWNQLDAINKDLEKYISKWDDIKHLNSVEFGPKDLFSSMLFYNLNDKTTKSRFMCKNRDTN